VQRQVSHASELLSRHAQRLAAPSPSTGRFSDEPLSAAAVGPETAAGQHRTRANTAFFSNEFGSLQASLDRVHEALAALQQPIGGPSPSPSTASERIEVALQQLNTSLGALGGARQEEAEQSLGPLLGSLQQSLQQQRQQQRQQAPVLPRGGEAAAPRSVSPRPQQEWVPQGSSVPQGSASRPRPEGASQGTATAYAERAAAVSMMSIVGPPPAAASNAKASSRPTAWLSQASPPHPRGPAAASTFGRLPNSDVPLGLDTRGHSPTGTMGAHEEDSGTLSQPWQLQPAGDLSSQGSYAHSQPQEDSSRQVGSSAVSSAGSQYMRPAAGGQQPSVTSELSPSAMPLSMGARSPAAGTSIRSATDELRSTVASIMQDQQQRRSDGSQGMGLQPLPRAPAPSPAPLSSPSRLASVQEAQSSLPGVQEEELHSSRVGQPRLAGGLSLPTISSPRQGNQELGVLFPPKAIDRRARYSSLDWV
jgi:hypothetical protein